MLAPPKPPHDELELLIKEARERQLRRRLLGAAGVAVAAAIELSVYALTIGGRPTNLAQPPAQGGRVTGPACRSSQLSVAVSFQGATLPPAQPTIRIAGDGSRLPVREEALTGSFLPTTWKPARVLTPGTKAEVLPDWGRLRWCGKSARPTPRFVLRFANGLRLSGIASLLTLPGCGLGRSWIGVSRPLIESS